ncbi:MAG: competence protein TfoX [Clostridia bacterium]|nr:competence protein TfoX [Clostridia bacterium]
MPSSKEYLDFILDMLSGTEGITWRAMMGEYIIYCRNIVVGGIYDDRFLVKRTKSSENMMPNSTLELPYKGGKQMLLVEDIENRDFLSALLTAISEDLSACDKRR